MVERLHNSGIFKILRVFEIRVFEYWAGIRNSGKSTKNFREIETFSEINARTHVPRGHHLMQDGGRFAFPSGVREV
jgi:hypothetical protein